jgi:transcriptional regulator with XRE-family HTH domain
MAAMARRNDLARTVNERIAALHAKSLQEIADRCEPPVQMPYLSKVANGLIKRPDEEKLRGIAVGLGLPLRTLQEAMLRPPRPASETEADLPADLVAAFSRAQRRLSAEELADFYANIRDMADLVSRSSAEREYGPTNYRPPGDEPS